MQIGVLGDIIFQVSRKQVLTLSNLQWNGSARYAVHQRHLHNALTEFTGLDPDSISLDIYLSNALGIDPMKQIWMLFQYERQARAIPLTIGDHGYGKYRWTVTSHSTTVHHTDQTGKITEATITLNLQEYLRQ